MPKTRCVICKACNVRDEANKHPSRDTLFRYSQLMTLISSRSAEAIATICETHRNPLQFNTIVIDLFASADKLKESLRTGIPLSVMRF